MTIILFEVFIYRSFIFSDTFTFVENKKQIVDLEAKDNLLVREVL